MKLVFATNNRHKLEEITRMLKDKYEIISLEEIGCREEIPEDYETLQENALEIARYVKEHYGYDCFADDTGLEIEALGNLTLWVFVGGVFCPLCGACKKFRG